MQFAGLLGLFAVLSWVLRRRPDVAALSILALWVLLPAMAGELLSGIPFTAASLASMHPAVWLTFVYLAVFTCVGLDSLTNTVTRLPGELVLLGWVIALAGGLTLTQLDRASLKSLIGTLVAGALWLVLCVIAGASNPRFASWLLWTLVGLAGINAIVSMLQSGIGRSWPYGFYRQMYQADFNPLNVRTSGTTDHPLLLSLLVVAALPLVSVAKRPLISYGLGIALLIALLQSGSRAGLIIGVGGLTTALLLRLRNSFQSVVLILTLAATGILLILSELGQNVLTRFGADRASNQVRDEAYIYVFDHWTDFGLVGSGYASSFDLKDSGLLPGSLENAYVMLAVDLGLVGAGMFLAVQVAILVRAWRRCVAWEPLIACVAVVTCAATFSSFEVPSAAMILVWAPFAVAMTAGPDLRRHPSPSDVAPGGSDPAGVVERRVLDSGMRRPRPRSLGGSATGSPGNAGSGPGLKERESREEG